jgi:hypothetical protein
MADKGERLAVFVSCPATLTDSQIEARELILRELDERPIGIIRIERSDYMEVPWEQLRQTISNADGVVVFGFRQLHVATGEWRPGTDEARAIAGWYSTPWSQIEAGLAIMAELPVLAIADPELTDGVFSSDVWGDGVFGLTLHMENGDWAFSAQVFESWLAAVSARAVQTHR